MGSNGLNLNVFDTPAAPQHTCTAIADRATSRSCNCFETGPGWHALPGRGSLHCLFQNVAFAAYFPLCTFFCRTACGQQTLDKHLELELRVLCQRHLCSCPHCFCRLGFLDQTVVHVKNLLAKTIVVAASNVAKLLEGRKAKIMVEALLGPGLQLTTSGSATFSHKALSAFRVVPR